MQRSLAIWIVVLGLGVVVLAGLVYLAAEQHQTLSRLQAENQQLREETRELEALRTQAKELQRLRGQEAEIQLLREENKDLLRLRNEVHQLQEQQRQTEALRAANAALLQAVPGANLTTNQQAAIAAVRREGAVLGLKIHSANDPQDPQSTPAPYNGAIVTWIDPASPVASSGVKVGDIIVRLEGHPIENAGQLQAEMLAHKPGDTVMLDVMRNNELLHLPVQTRGWPQ
jgi:C-terminal processing protease CtpA/Prc